MQKSLLLTFVVVFYIVVLAANVSADNGAFAYPYYLIDISNPENNCWKGMGVNGVWPVPVIPQEWLVGTPPSEVSGVTFPTDHWVELLFRGDIVDGPGDDILIIESGQCGEQALVFLTDGVSKEYLLNIATALNTGFQEQTLIGFDIADVSLPFVPCAIRVLAVDLRGGSPGFDISNVRARVKGECGEIACDPYPPNGAKYVPPDTVLSWLPGSSADRHVVYFGTTIADAYEDTGVIDDPSQPQDANNYDPHGLNLGETYYWRVDEVNDNDPNHPQRGDVWSFNVVQCLTVDNFEFYNRINNWITSVWQMKEYAIVGLKDNMAHSCSQSMSLGYYYGEGSYSEAVRTFSSPQDWMSAGIKVLELFFRGRSANTGSGRMYVALSDGSASTLIQYSGDVNDIRKEQWQPWRIDLTSVTGINLGSVESLTIGFDLGSAGPDALGSGIAYFDDIKLCSLMCLEENESTPDLNSDCCVDYHDLDEMAYSWLKSGYSVYPAVAPNTPLLWLKFDGDAQDYSGNGYDGMAIGNPSYVDGVVGFGQAISLDGYGDSITISGAGTLFNSIISGITITFWQKGADSMHLVDTICCSDYEYGAKNPTIAINLGLWRPPGRYNWNCGYFDSHLSRNHRYMSEWAGQWNHWAFTKDVTKGTMQIFLNGVLYDSKIGATSPISGISSFEIGSGWYGGYDGLLDDFRIYDYALSQPEIAYVATNGTGVFNQELILPADLNLDDHIDLIDFVIIANNWLDEQLWP